MHYRLFTLLEFSKNTKNTHKTSKSFRMQQKTYRLVTFSRLVTHFCCGHNVRRFARGHYTLKIYKYIHISCFYVKLKLKKFRLLFYKAKILYNFYCIYYLWERVKVAQRNFWTRAQNCTKTILHELHFCTKVKKKQKSKR